MLNTCVENCVVFCLHKILSIKMRLSWFVTKIRKSKICQQCVDGGVARKKFFERVYLYVCVHSLPYRSTHWRCISLCSLSPPMCMLTFHYIMRARNWPRQEQHQQIQCQWDEPLFGGEPACAVETMVEWTQQHSHSFSRVNGVPLTFSICKPKLYQFVLQCVIAELYLSDVWCGLHIWSLLHLHWNNRRRRHSAFLLIFCKKRKL